MTLITATIAGTVAASRAARNWAANLRSLAIAQPSLVERVQSLSVHGEWVMARDGSLTLLDDAGRWIGDCSLPYRAAVAMLKSLDPRGTVACFLAPNHAAEIRSALDRLNKQQAVIVLQPDVQVLRTILACEDFSADFESHRLHVATGEAWADDLRALFINHPGLPTPQQFIKLPTIASEIAEPLIAESQKVFAEAINARAEQIRVLRDAPRSESKNVCRLGVIAGSRFSLWDDAGAALAEALRPASLVAASNEQIKLAVLDPDVPIYAGPVATAEFCQQCDAIVTADTARCDFPDVLPLNLPWVTWVTKGRVPAFSSAGPRDSLLVADAVWQKVAIEAGWPAERVNVATFPTIQKHAALDTAIFDGWTIFSDTVPVSVPEKLEDFSSHRLLWEAIAAELATDPFAIGEDIAMYLHKQARSMNIDDATIDRRFFIDSLIVPAYQQGIVRAMVKNRLPVRAFGFGWDQIGEFKPIAAGPIESRAKLAEALGSTRRLAHVWPLPQAHPIDGAGIPVLRRKLSRLESFLQQARQPQSVPVMPPPTDPISLQKILSVLTHISDPPRDRPRLY